MPAEIIAAISVLQFWPETNVVLLAAYITIFLLIIVLGNVFPVRIYGYIEYCVSWVKILAIFVMVFFLFIMTYSGAWRATRCHVLEESWRLEERQQGHC